MREKRWTRRPWELGADERYVAVADEPKGHPAAEQFRMIADEAAVNPRPWKAFEYRDVISMWTPCPDIQTALLSAAQERLRRKPRTVTVNGIEVPAPMREAPKMGTIYWTITAAYPDGVLKKSWGNSPMDLRRLNAGFVWATEADARAAFEAISKALGGE